MRFNRLDLNLLVALEVLLTECSTTKAAKRLYLSQPATSSVLSRLRDYFQDPLLQSQGRSMIRTPRGDSLLQPVREVLQQLRAISDIGAEFNPATATQHFRIVATDYVVSVLLAPLANRISEEAPGITLEIAPPYPDADVALARRDIDLIVGPRDHLAGDHRQQALLHDDYVCVLWNQHPEVGPQITREQFANLPHVTVQFSAAGGRSGARDWVESQLGVQRRVEITAANFSCLPEFLVGSRRIATMRRGMVQQLLRWHPLRMAELPQPVPAMEEVMQWSAIVDNDRAHRWLRNALTELAAQHAAGARPAPRAVLSGAAIALPPLSALAA
ncbi:LysR family transcriptional regulator [Duganella sp. FT80W]|uniref:LysR family transcriptional regulator n=1 Tax=Duganella guangzhouensis TaxID=2666084 RepID=A0A6I2L1M6_9BURK|nr:LysR family transcriptional regulator [Duganella guangzhouensis]MRW92068.1 LysR family transcriptional regulator [Duganella guangzhouensis]